MLGILLRVVSEELRPFAVGLGISRAPGSAGDGIDESPPILDAAMRLRTGTEDAEASHVEIEEVGRGVDAPQSTVEFEVVALVTLHETS